MSFDARESTIAKLFNNAIYQIPRNQRLYTWNEQNWNDLYNDIMLVTDKTAQSHFLGSIVLKQEEGDTGVDVYTVIDGQQRILTLSILINAILYQLKTRNMVADAKGTQRYVTTPNDKGEEREIVDAENNPLIKKLSNYICGLDVKNNEEINIKKDIKKLYISNNDKLIGSAFFYFSQKLEALSDTDLLHFRDAVVATQYVNISSSTEEDIYTIFEILNARGLPLNTSDLLKNFIMRYIQPQQRRDEAKQIWNDIENKLEDKIEMFLRHYTTHKFEKRGSEKDAYKIIRDNTDPHKTKDLLDDLKRKSIYYSDIVNPDLTKEDGRIFSFFNQRRVIVYRPLMLSLIHQYSIEEISRKTYIDCLTFLYKFFVAFSVINDNKANLITDTISKYSEMLENRFNGQQTINEWINAFKEKLPTANQFDVSLRSIGWSHKNPIFSDSRRKDQCKIILELLERMKTSFAPVGDYTIEHILPDSDSKENYMIGNLLLLEDALNRRCKDKSFEEKLDIYKESHFTTTRDFVLRYSNSDKLFNPEERAHYIAKEIAEYIEL